MEVKVFVFNPFQVNTYVLYNDSGSALIIDPACSAEDEEEMLVRFISEKKLTPMLLVNTHCHIDHILGVESLKKRYGIECAAHSAELPMLEAAPQHALMFGFSMEYTPTIDRMLADGDSVNLGNESLRVIHTPGHTPGGISLYASGSNFLITGDTLFKGSIGRTDLEGGNYEQLFKSISDKLLVLPEGAQIYPGHGESSTIGNEKRHNPFLQ